MVPLFTSARRRSERRDPAAAASGSAPAALPSFVRLHECSSELVLAAAHDVMVGAWRSNITAARVRRIEAWVAQLSLEYGRLSVLSVYEPEVISPPDAAAREAAARLSETFADSCLGVALVIEGTSIKHTVVRLAITTVNLVASQRVPQAVFDTVDAASHWVCQRTTKLGERELAAAVAAVRSQPPR